MILVPTAIVLSWWSGTIGDRDLFARETYGIAGWDLVAYGLFMFALTLLLGAVIRRVGWALAASVLLFLLAAFSLPSQVRSHLVTPTVKWSEPYVVTNGDFTGSARPIPITRGFWSKALCLVRPPVFRRTAKYLRRIQSRFVHREIADEDRERIREGRTRVLQEIPCGERRGLYSRRPVLDPPIS